MGFIVEKADLMEDQKRIVEFWIQNFPTWPEGKYVWFYQNNVAGPADCWVVREENSDSVIGTTAIFPRKFCINGKEYLAGITGDFGVDKQHRILGPALKLQREVVQSCENGKYHFLYGFPNTRSEPVQRRAGFVQLGSAVRLVKVTHSFRYLKRLLKIGIVAKALSLLFDIILHILSRETRYQLSHEIRGNILSEFDHRFDELWKSASSNFSLIGERNQKFLTWRFQNCPYQNYQIFVLENKSNGKLIGYVVFVEENDNLIIIDCLARDVNKAFRDLIAAFLKQVRKTKADNVSIVYLGNDFLINLLKEFGFSERADKRNIVVYVHKDSPIAELVKDPNVWYFLAADND
ncbi:MAG: GNAT family N-acetyltransferase [Candidatus Helarchaeota archaeon]